MQDEQQIDIFADRKVTRLGNTWYFELQSINLRVKVDNITSDIEIILFLFNFSFKKIKPNKTLIIGKIKYPKLASIILFVETAYIQSVQLKNIKILVIKR